MAMTPMPTPAPSRTMSQADFDAAAALHIAALPAFITEANELQTDVNAKQATASAAAVVATDKEALTNADAIATAADRVQTGLDATAAANSAASAAAIAGAFVGTSTTSLLIEVASKTFTTQADEQYAAGQWVTAVSAANGANNMYGQVTSYSGTTLIVDMQVIGGSGTFADWNLSIAGVRGAQGAAGTLSGTAAGTIDLLTGTNIASAATINLDTTTGNRVHITGTTTITAVTLTRGPRTVIFDGILTLTHHATNNNLPSAANITTAAGDRAIYESDGTTVYCVDYIKASGTAVVASPPGLTLLSVVTASASATVDIETTFNGTYDAYVLIVSGLTLAGGNTLFARLKLAGAYVTTATYGWLRHETINATYNGYVGASLGEITLMDGATTDTANATNLEIHIVNPASTVQVKSISWRGHATRGAPAAVLLGGAAMNAGISAMTGIRFYQSSGSMTGTFRLYGVKNS